MDRVVRAVRNTRDRESDMNDVDKTPSLIHKNLLPAQTIYYLQYLAQVSNEENGSNSDSVSLNLPGT
ncbi:hypothetical protein E2K66_12465, partial [Escherichia coli]